MDITILTLLDYRIILDLIRFVGNSVDISTPFAYCHCPPLAFVVRLFYGKSSQKDY